MAKIVFSVFASNSMVEKAFSLLTLLLSDKRLWLKHETIESLMKINLSDKIWTEKGKNEILERAVDVYLKVNGEERRMLNHQRRYLAWSVTMKIPKKGFQNLTKKMT